MPRRRDGGTGRGVSAADQPAGITSWLKRRDRRLTATWLLGHDRTVNVIPRSIARLLSAYERAHARYVIWALLQEFPLLDEPLLWLVRRFTFALAGRPRGDDDPRLDFSLPASGVAGNLLVLLVWASVVGLVVWLLR